MKIFKKIRREIFLGLSKMALKGTTVSGGNKKIKIPLKNGMGGALFLRDDKWRKMVFSLVPDDKKNVVLDVGVNIGQSLLDFMTETPTVQYYGFEPNAACVFYVNDLIHRNEFWNCSVLPVGLNNKNEMLTLLTKRWADASGSVVQRSVINQRRLVYTIHGDEFISREKIEDIRMIKIDVEGFEYEVMTGLNETIKKNRPLIFCEINIWGRNVEEMNSFLASLDYGIISRNEMSESYKIEKLHDPNRSWGDYLFVPKKDLDVILEQLSKKL